jgi:hypothetical protein
MTGVAWQHRFLGALLILVVVAPVQGCVGNQDRTTAVDRDQDRTVVDWDSPRMREIEKEWQALWDGYNKDSTKSDSKSEYGRVMMAVDRLFRNRFSARSLRQLAASAEKAPIPHYQGDSFESIVLEFMVEALVESGDRESLVKLLSKRCPSRVGWMRTIEYCVAYSGWRIKDPILILGEAYSNCQVPETRHALAAALRRSFAGFGIQAKDDPEFVSNAMRWYMKEKGGLIVNREYYRNENSSITIETYEQHPEYYEKPPWPTEPLFRRGAFAPGVPNLSEEADQS